MRLDNNRITKFVTKYKPKRKIEREIYERVEFMGNNRITLQQNINYIGRIRLEWPIKRWRHMSVMSEVR